MQRLESLLVRFNRLARPGPFKAPWTHHHDGGKHDFHLVFGVMIHGDEFGSLPAAVALVEGLILGQINFGGRLTVFVGNPEAARKNRRFLQADLNRVFLDTKHDRHEDKIAKRLMPILDTADLFVDFHQTILPTRQPFYICGWRQDSWRWARVLGSASVWVTRDPSIPFSDDTRCSDEYVVARGKPALTVELSQQGFNEPAEEICMSTMCRAMRAADAVEGGHSLVDLAEQAEPLTFFTGSHAERFATPDLALTDGLVNFQPVKEGQDLARDDSPPLIVPHDGMLLFPKYPQRDDGLAIPPWPKEIFRVITPLDVHPVQLWGRDST